jgi:DNA replication and repair protein RecF
VIKSLQLYNFRNFSDAKIEFSPKINIFLGKNGQGKTNILEAISVLTSGSSFRYAENENFIQDGKSESAIRGKYTNEGLDYDLQVSILKSRKNHILNEKRINAVSALQMFPQVVFSPESLASIKEGADHRRQLVDELLVSISASNAKLILDFRHALKTRNKILKNYVNGDVARNETLSLLESINPSFLKLAAELTDQRINALRMLMPEFTNAMRYISNDPKVEISVEYVISGVSAGQFSASEISKSLLMRANELRDAELATGSSLVGPQKHDLVFLYNQKDSRFYCSQGQQRALINGLEMSIQH